MKSDEAGDIEIYKKNTRELIKNFLNVTNKCLRQLQNVHKSEDDVPEIDDIIIMTGVLAKPYMASCLVEQQGLPKDFIYFWLLNNALLCLEQSSDADIPYKDEDLRTLKKIVERQKKTYSANTKIIFN